VAAISNAMMVTGAYPLLPMALRALQKRQVGSLRTALTEWGMSMAVSAARPVGFLPCPGHASTGRGR